MTRSANGDERTANTAVFFDVDETLVRAEATVQTIYERTCARFEIEANAAACQYYLDQFFEHLKSGHGDAYRPAAEELATAYSLPVDVDSFVGEYTTQEVTATSVHPTVRETVSRLSEDCFLGVITNGVGSVQRAKLQRHGLVDYFERIVSASDVDAVKPDPEPFEVAKQSTDADRLVYVGDSVQKDAAPAQSAGFTTVLVGNHDSDAADLVVPDHGAFAVLTEFLGV